MTEPQEQEQQEEIVRPDPQDFIDTLIEELAQRDQQIAFERDQRMFYKAQAKKLQRELTEAAAHTHEEPAVAEKKAPTKSLSRVK